MFSVHEDERQLALTISSDNRLVDRATEQCRQFLLSHAIPLGPDVTTPLREFLINAIEHGNKNDTNLKVSCAVNILENGRISICVEDEGEGFDYADLDLSIPENPGQERHRGLALANTLTDSIEFSGRGNKIMAYITPARETEFDSREHGGVQVITSSGDITASAADSLRILLLDLLSSGCNRFRFDMCHVQDMDSMGLSVLIVFARMLAESSNDSLLEMVNANEDITLLFELTRLDRVFGLIAAERN